VHRPTIALDFDGVLRAGQDDDGDDDGWIVGAHAALRRLAESYRVIVFSCRCLDPGGRQDIWLWLSERGADKLVHEVTARKPDAVAYVDDKAVRFRGDWPEVERLVAGVI
jgi:hypothetical protein